MEKVLNKCPICGSKLEYSALMQYSNVYSIKRNGELSVNCRKRSEGSMECGFISCSSPECDFTTDCDLDCDKFPGIKIWCENGKFYYDEES